MNTLKWIPHIDTTMDSIPVIDSPPRGWDHQDSNRNTHIYRNNAWDHPELLEVLVVYQGEVDGKTRGLVALEYTDAQILIDDREVIGSPSDINAVASEMMETGVDKTKEHIKG